MVKLGGKVIEQRSEWHLSCESLREIACRGRQQPRYIPMLKMNLPTFELASVKLDDPSLSFSFSEIKVVGAQGHTCSEWKIFPKTACLQDR